MPVAEAAAPRDEEAAGAMLESDLGEDASRRERLAALIENRLDWPMAVLALVWALLVAYDLVAPANQRETLDLVGNVIWGVFVVEFVVKLVVSGRPARFLRKRWPSLVFLVLPALRMLRVIRALRVIRLLPAARVAGASYRAIGTARGLLANRLGFLAIATGVVAFSGGQLLFLLESGQGLDSLGDALWWSTVLSLSSSLVYEPSTLAGRLLALVLSAWSVVVVAAVAGTLGAFFVESRQERAAEEAASGGG